MLPSCYTINIIMVWEEFAKKNGEKFGGVENKAYFYRGLRLCSGTMSRDIISAPILQFHGIKGITNSKNWMPYENVCNRTQVQPVERA